MKKENIRPENSRRDFIKSFVRNFALLGIVSTSAFLLFKEKSGEECNLDFICKSCKKKTSCSLPEAEQYRAKKIKS